jgi:copper oxidase (laccase) domain-containing protein
MDEIPLAGPVPRFEVPGWRERFGVVAGITGRGDTAGRGFDLGLSTDAPVGEALGRWRTFRGAEPGFEHVVLGNQVHGAEIMEAGAGRGWLQVDGIDGWVTAMPGTLLTVTVADCIPVYLVVPGRGVALLHAGWRGTAAGILERGVAGLAKRAGVTVADIIMHCGVGICGSCYEVGAEVMAGCGLPAEGPGPWHLDLRAHLADRGMRLGLRDVTVSSLCSAHGRDRFYSHRASRGADGRMAGYLGLLPQEARHATSGATTRHVASLDALG